MLEIPLLEGGSVDGDDGVLDKSLGSSELIVSCVISGINDSGLSSDRFGLPSEVSVIERESSELKVSSSSSDGNVSL